MTSRSGTQCAFVHPDPWMGASGKCGRFVSRERAAIGERLCSAHDTKCKDKTRAAHAARQARRHPSPLAVHRDSLISSIKELYIWWDGPGSEGREV